MGGGGGINSICIMYMSLSFCTSGRTVCTLEGPLLNPEMIAFKQGYIFIILLIPWSHILSYGGKEKGKEKRERRKAEGKAGGGEYFIKAIKMWGRKSTEGEGKKGREGVIYFLYCQVRSY